MRQSLQLPISYSPPHRLGSHAWRIKKQLSVRSIVLLAVLLATFLYGAAKRWQGWETHRDRPPLYEEYHRAELALPQHDTTDPFSNGKKYLWVNNHVSG